MNIKDTKYIFATIFLLTFKNFPDDLTNRSKVMASILCFTNGIFKTVRKFWKNSKVFGKINEKQGTKKKNFTGLLTKQFFFTNLLKNFQHYYYAKIFNMVDFIFSNFRCIEKYWNIDGLKHLVCAIDLWLNSFRVKILFFNKIFSQHCHLNR